MSDNRKYYYMKLKENFFDTEEMILLESMPDGYLYSNILMKLYLRSLKDEGRLMFRGVIPYTPDALANVVRHNVGVVEKAIKVFKQFGLIEILDNGAIFMTDLQNFIGQSSSEGDRKRESRRRIDTEKEVLKLENGQKSGQMSVQTSKNGQKSGQMSDVHPPELELEIEKELEREEDRNSALLQRNFELVKSTFEQLHGRLFPYKDSPMLERLLKEGVKPDVIIGTMNEKCKPTIKTFGYYEGAIRDYMEEASASGKSTIGKTGQAAYRPITADYYNKPELTSEQFESIRNVRG